MPRVLGLRLGNEVRRQGGAKIDSRFRSWFTFRAAAERLERQGLIVHELLLGRRRHDHGAHVSGIDGFEEMVARYDVVELNTAVKPFYMSYLYDRDPSVQAVIYLDPDILLYSSLAPLVEKLRCHSIAVTPHSCTYDDSETTIYYETGMLGAGVYNLGFLATARSSNTDALLRWWQRRSSSSASSLRRHAWPQRRRPQARQSARAG